ncbi:MAG TPA: hypothetical protein VE548_08415, partial [Nitrososphaeraceae archaeon]|nr:hypothetical protein [Nitrososphaeraceae archaeon]
IRNQLQQQEPISCYHQCTRCAIIFHCESVSYSHRHLSRDNQCENPFLVNVIHVKGANSWGSRKRYQPFDVKYYN